MEIPKPITTFAGPETQTPLQLKEIIERDLPQEGVEWQRPYRRQQKTVFLETRFEHYTENISSKNQLLEKQLLHTFWIECYDVDTYKQCHRENLINWINKFSKLNFSEWLVVLIDNSDKKSNKTKLLPRSSVSDKIKADFPTNLKGVIDSHFSILSDPLKKDYKVSETFFQLLNKIRYLLLSSYSKQLKNYEEYIRSQREQRNNPNWNFFEFFLYQEELAFAYELLGLYDEALVQYDELDALFSQFILNVNLNKLPYWLKDVIDLSNVWHGLCLSNVISLQLKEKLIKSKASLLDVRNYLFARQCELLLLQHMPWEVTTRSLPFLQNCINEIKLLEINLMPGALECWVFLSASEILSICERYNDSSQMDSYSKNTIDVRSFSRKNLKALGDIYGLFPETKLKPNYYHHVANLIAGMGEDYCKDSKTKSFQICLKDALNNNDIFLKNYLEYSELTMGTFKHIGRMREARLIGKELALIYMRMKNYNLALSFLTDLEKVFIVENWPMLLADVRIHILKCYEALDEKRKQIIYCLHLSTCLSLSFEHRKKYFQKFVCLSEENLFKEKHVKLKMNEIFNLISLNFINGNDEKNSNFKNILKLKLNSNLADNLICGKLVFYLKYSDKKYSSGILIKSNENLIETIKKKNEKLLFQSLQNTNVGIFCKNLEKMLKRSDSLLPYSIDKDLLLNEYEEKFTCEQVCIVPGENEFELDFKNSNEGVYVLSQFCVYIKPNIYLISNEFEHLYFEVVFQEPSLKVLNKNKILSNDLLIGIVQEIKLIFDSGSNQFESNSTLEIKSSPDLKMKFSNHDTLFQDHLVYKLKDGLKPFESIFIDLNIIDNLEHEKACDIVIRNIFITYELNNITKTLKTDLFFNVPFICTTNLHTCESKKFIQVSLSLNANLKFKLWKPELKFINLNEQDGLIKCYYLGDVNTISKIQLDESVNFLWEVSCESNNSLFELEFFINYALLNQDKIQDLKGIFKHNFTLKEFNTLYTVRISINPQTGSEFCRVGSLCHLCVKLEKNFTLYDKKFAIMFELVTDKTLWAINGRTAGVLDEIKADKCELNFEVLPLISGFLTLPTIKLSKYIKDAQITLSSENKLLTLNSAQNSNVKLVAFDVGQVYNYSRCLQVNVLPSSGFIVSE